jgi:hypothetical protein
MMFIDLTETEVEEFKQWARDNYTPNKECSPVWHPVVVTEWQLIKKEQTSSHNEYIDTSGV